MARQRPGLRAPRPGDASLVPSTSRRRPLWRVCDRRHAEPWFFSSRDTVADPGRFDLTHPNGTSYWALTAVAAIIEATADPDALEPPAIVLDDLARLTVWGAPHVPQARRQRLADTTVASVPRLTGEISTIVPYDLPWAWADAFHDDDRTGIRYRGRFSHDDSVAVFGTSGVPDFGPAASPTTAVSHYDDLPDGFRAFVDGVDSLDNYARGISPG